MEKLQLDQLNRLTPEEFKTAKKLPVVVILDNVRSMNNIGSAFRSGDAMAVSEIALCGITAKPPHREIHKTALGAQDVVPWQYFDHTQAAIDHYKSLGYKIMGLEQVSESTSLEEKVYEAEEKYAFVFGNEVSGVSDDVIDSIDEFLEIPQFGTKHSFNVSVTIGICLWDYFSKSQTNLR